MASLAKFESEFSNAERLTGNHLFSGNDRKKLHEIIRERSFRTGTFTLSSGKTSPLYFNMKPTIMPPTGAALSAKAFLDLMFAVDAEYVSGLEMGAVPTIGAMAAVSELYGRPVKTTFVRKRKKEHGTKELIEGLGPNESIRGKAVFVIDDVATSGKSILQAVEEVRKVGGIVRDAAALVNRHEGGNELLASEGVILHQIFAASDFVY